MSKNQIGKFGWKQLFSQLQQFGLNDCRFQVLSPETYSKMRQSQTAQGLETGSLYDTYRQMLSNRPETFQLQSPAELRRSQIFAADPIHPT